MALAQATGPVHVVLSTQGIEEWDKPGEPAHDPEALAEMVDEFRAAVRAPVMMTEVDCHINDQGFADAAMAVLDGWIAEGRVKM